MFSPENGEDEGQDFNLQTCDDVSENQRINEDCDVVYTPDDRPTDRLSRPTSSNASESIRPNTNSQSWFRAIFSLPEKRILERCGKDALFYLRFQRHIIFFLFIVMIISICIILPINLQGKFRNHYTICNAKIYRNSF